jgi:hypothetical protein
MVHWFEDSGARMFEFVFPSDGITKAGSLTVIKEKKRKGKEEKGDQFSPFHPSTP